MTHWPRYILLVFVAGSCVVNAYTMKEAFKDLWIETRPPGMTFMFQLVAWRSLRNEIATFILQALFLYLRVWSLMWPDPGNPQFVTRWRIDITLLTSAQVLLAVNSYWNLVDRKRIFYFMLRDGL